MASKPLFTVENNHMNDFSFIDIWRKILLPYLRIAAVDELMNKSSPQALAYSPKNFLLLSCYDGIIPVYIYGARKQGRTCKARLRKKYYSSSNNSIKVSDDHSP